MRPRRYALKGRCSGVPETACRRLHLVKAHLPEPPLDRILMRRFPASEAFAPVDCSRRCSQYLCVYVRGKNTALDMKTRSHYAILQYPRDIVLRETIHSNFVHAC
jgi:hypothetical protein